MKTFLFCCLFLPAIGASAFNYDETWSDRIEYGNDPYTYWDYTVTAKLNYSDTWTVLHPTAAGATSKGRFLPSPSASANVWAILPQGRQFRAEAGAGSYIRYKVELDYHASATDIPIILEWSTVNMATGSHITSTAWVRFYTLTTNIAHYGAAGAGTATASGQDVITLPNSDSIIYVSLDTGATAKDQVLAEYMNAASAIASVPNVYVDPSYAYAAEITLSLSGEGVGVMNPIHLASGDANPSPVIDTVVSDEANISWVSMTGQVYQVQYSTNLVSTNWFDLGSTVIGNGTTNTVADSTATNSARFYRVILD